MRASEKGMSSFDGENQLFGVNFHSFMEREKNTDSFELASEFGLTLAGVRQLKKKMERS
ncbi:MAG: RNA polymerase subunit sigma-70 [Bacillota bacterium]